MRGFFGQSSSCTEKTLGNQKSVMMFSPGSMGSMDALREYLIANHPQVKIIDFSLYNIGVFNECENGGRLLITTERWKTVHPPPTPKDCPHGLEAWYAIRFDVLQNPG